VRDKLFEKHVLIMVSMSLVRAVTSRSLVTH